MTIQINEEQKVVTEGTTVFDVVFSLLQLNAAGLAIAINEAIVPRHRWETTLLQANDKILLIKAAAGG